MEMEIIKRLADLTISNSRLYMTELKFYILLGVYIFLVMMLTMTLMNTDWLSSNIFG